MASAMIVARLPKPMAVAANTVSSARVGIARDTLVTVTVSPPPRPMWPRVRASGRANSEASSTAKNEM